MPATPPDQADSFVLSTRGVSFRVVDTPLARSAAAELGRGAEYGLLEFFDAALPLCDQVVDCGASAGLHALYAATRGARVHAFEPDAAAYAVLAANVGANPELAARVVLHRHGLGSPDGRVRLSGRPSDGPGQRLPIRPAADTLSALGLNRRTLLKFDVEGAEHGAVPLLEPLVAEARPFVVASVYSFSFVISDDAYVTAVARLRSAIAIAAAMDSYPHMYVYRPEGWIGVDHPSREHFLRHALLRPGPASERAAATTEALAFSDEPLAALRR